MKTPPYVIYNGRGTLTSSFSGYFLNLKELCQGDWIETTSVFIMPGGRDGPYHEDLKGLGNTQIRQFVEKGGTYIGICAGAYYGCKRVEFDLGFPLEVCQDRELCFFSGKAMGPAYGKGTFNYSNNSGARAAKISTEKGALTLYYNGGCQFEGDFTKCKILGRYAELPKEPIAIIECPIGKGRAILSGVHLETSVHFLDATDYYLSPLIPILKRDENKRIEFWNNLLRNCEIANPAL